ncbi:MAG: T9SS type A sorting domain-containing protein, partial [Saprospiraceae bacterium]|nr:T9SS type A sorting domain-containing protein [Saprospiraceae bacterium]
NYNDTLSVSGINIALPSGPFIIGSSPSADYTSFTSAINDLNQHGICGPTVFNVEAGTYNEQLVLNQVLGVSPNNTITFQSVSGNNSDVILTYNSSSSSNYVIQLDGGDFFIFKNMTIKATNYNYSRVIDVNQNSNFNEFIGNKIIGVNGPGVNLNNPNIFINEVNTDNNSFINNTIEYGSDGFYINGASSNYISGILIEGNSIINCSQSIYLRYIETSNIRSNTIMQSSSSNSTVIFSYKCGEGMKYEKNKITMTTSGNCLGIWLNLCTSTTQSPTYITNNFIIKTGISNQENKGIRIEQSNNINVYYNSVNITSGSVNSTAFYYVSGNNINVKNNIFCNTGIGYTMYYNSPPNTANFSSDNNNLYTVGNKFIYLSGDRSNLLAYQQYSNMDANSVSVIPGFISPSDLHIFNTTLNGVGYIITEITDDYDGDIRSSTNPDIGADEYNMFLNDVGPISVDLPINPTFAGTKNFKISIQNFGSNQLTTTTINWKVDNVLKTPFVWTGSLTHLSKDSLISIGSHNLTMGNHTITIWTSLPNNVSDQYPNNDTITYQISVIALPNIDVSLNALNITVTNCNDSIIVPIVIKNTGQSWLNFSVGDQNPDTVEILALIHGYQSTYFNNLLSSVDAYFTKYNITTTTSTNNTTMQSLLIGKDLVIIPFVVTTIGVSQIQSLFPILQTYVNNGGTVLFMGQYYGSQLVLGSGMFSGTLYGTTNSKTMNIMNSNHPVTNSVASSFASGNYDFWMYTITNSNAVKLVEASFFGTPYEVITYRRIGNGYAIINGFEFDYLSTNNNIKKLIANTFKWSKTNTNPKWLQRSFMQDSISGSDSSIVNIEFNSNGLSNGTYITSFKILSNDAQQPVTHIPCTLNVIGSPDISVATNLVTFPSTPIGSVASDSVVVTNNGCDNLVITSITSNSNQFTVNGLVGSDTILPGDFKVYYINFSPTTVGAIIGAVTILSNDTNALISLSGTGVGAPNISVLPSLNVTIPFCNDSVNVPYTIKNIGQLSLNVNVESDTIEILALIHGYWSNYWNNYINSISSYVNKFNLDTTTTTDTVVLKNLLLGKDMVFIPNINDLSGVNQIQALSPILQYYVNNGGTVLFAGQYTNNSQLVFGTGFFTGTSSGRVTTSQTINVINSNHPITNGVSSSSPTGNVILYKYIITNNDAVKLVQSTIMGTTYDIVAYRKIGNGYVVVNSLDYNYPPSSDIQKLLANTVLWSKTNTNSDWLEITNSQYLIQPSDSVIINIEFNSKNLAIGTHMSSFNIKSNDIQTPNLIIPCTLTAQNLLQNSVNLGNDTTVCGSYTLNAGLYNNYLWNTNDTSATINVTSTGTYSVTVSNGHCIDADTISFMNIAPIVTMSGLSPSYCENNSPDTLFVSPLGGTFSGNGVTGNIFNPPAAGYGTHTITYSYTDSLSVCTSKDSMNTTIIGGFIAELGSDTTICYGESLVINTSGGPIYLWSTGDTTNSIIVSPSVDSIFAVTVSDINSICSSSDTVTVFVDHPIVDIGSDTSIKMTYESVLLNAGTGFSSYLWDDNSTNQTRQIVGSNVGAGIHNYYVDVTDNNGCMASDTIIVEVIDDTGIINNNFGPSFNFYPNPTSGKIAVDLGKTYKSVDLTVRNLVGQIVLNKNYKSTNQLSFDMKGSTGVYFVEIRTDEGKSGVFKVVKE